MFHIMFLENQIILFKKKEMLKGHLIGKRLIKT